MSETQSAGLAPDCDCASEIGHPPGHPPSHRLVIHGAPMRTMRPIRPMRGASGGAACVSTHGGLNELCIVGTGTHDQAGAASRLGSSLGRQASSELLGGDRGGHDCLLGRSEDGSKSIKGGTADPCWSLECSSYPGRQLDGGSLSKFFPGHKRFALIAGFVMGGRESQRMWCLKADGR